MSSCKPRIISSKFRVGRKYNKNWATNNVTRFGEISPLCSSCKSLWQFLIVYLVFGKKINTLKHLDKFYCCKWPNIEQII